MVDMPADGMRAAAEKKDFGTSSGAALPSGYLTFAAMWKGKWSLLAHRDGSLRRGDTSAVGAKPEVRGAHSRRRPKATSAVKTKIVMSECLP
jgi:hypothetical protein